MVRLEHVQTGGRLPTSTFRLMDGDSEIGMLQLRHRPSHAADVPPDFANHIYYEIAEPNRGRGYGKQILALGLMEAAELRMTEVVITVMRSNPASQRIIESNGGVFVDERPCGEDVIRKFRITLA